MLFTEDTTYNVVKVLTASSIKMTASSDMTPCSFVEVYR
jgi:hypothetical protein